VSTIESIGSSTRIEGSKLTDRDVEHLLARLEIRKFETRDEQEVAGYAEVMEIISHAWVDIRVNENHIRQLHRDLLRYSVKDERHRGAYKTLRNDVGAFDAGGNMIGVVFETATPFDTPRRMAELVAWLEEARDLRRVHPLLIVAVFVVVFLAIHPFQDGNGRLSRFLTTLLLLQAGYAYVPYSSLESVIEQSKEGYYRAFRQTQTTIDADKPDWQPWLLFFLRALQQQKRRLAEKIEREKRALADLPELAVQILDYAQAHGRVTTRDMVREHAQGDVQELGCEEHAGPPRRWPLDMVQPAVSGGGAMDAPHMIERNRKLPWSRYYLRAANYGIEALLIGSLPRARPCPPYGSSIS
jgi:Fic family protein